MFALVVAAGLAVNAGTSWQSEVAKLLQEVPLPELTTRGSQIVANASDEERAEATVAVVKAVLAKSPSSAPALVGSIARTTPKMAAVAASTASTLKPAQARAITAAAVQSAPKQTKSIVHDTAKSLPTQYNHIAVAAAIVNPAASSDILSAVSTAVPAVKTYIDSASVSKSQVTDVIAVVDRQVVADTQKGTIIFRGAAVPGPDFQPLPVITTTYDEGDTTAVAAGTNRRVSSDGTPNQ